ncbi:MAG TPA: NAD(P)H-dependent oxidoreductase subunit E [Bryobacteraceae bacterium]
MDRPLHVLRLCRAQFCEEAGCEKTIAHVEERLGVRLGESTADGRVRVEAVYCLGMCGSGPGAMLDGVLHGGVTPEVADALIDGLPISRPPT